MPEEKTPQKKSWRYYLDLKKINFVIRVLTLSDIIIISSFGLITPIFAVFVTDSIKGGNVEVVGVAAGIFLVSKSIFQIPFAIIVDKIKGERDDFWALFTGTIFFSIVPLLYILVSTPLELYFVEFLHGMVTALTLPPWYAIFTRHVDKNYEAIEWGLYNTSVSLVSAGTAFAGGFLAYNYGFNFLFVAVSIISFIGSMFLLSIKSILRRGVVLF